MSEMLLVECGVQWGVCATCHGVELAPVHANALGCRSCEQVWRRWQRVACPDQVTWRITCAHGCTHDVCASHAATPLAGAAARRVRVAGPQQYAEHAGGESEGW